MSRDEFPVSVRKAAYARAGGICECGCGQPFTDHPKERPHYDHDLPDFLGGVNDLENCKVLRVCCHQVKTYGKDMGMIKKVRRGQKDRANLKAIKAAIPGSRGSKFKKKINGEVVRRD
jgi:hypothetical protein